MGGWYPETGAKGFAAAVDELPQPFMISRADAVGFLIDHRDRGTGNDVMELQQQGVLPRPAQELRIALLGNQRGNELSITQQPFAEAVMLLHKSLGGVSTAVVFQIELAISLGQQRLVQVLQMAEEVPAGGKAESAYSFQILLSEAIFDMVAGRAPAAVTNAIEVQESVADIALGIALFRFQEGGGIVREVIVVGGQLMRQNPGAVDAFPEEEVVGKGVGLVPAQLLGNECIHTAALHQLGQVAAETEAVRQPEHAGSDAELLFKEALAIHELADGGFQRDQIGVEFHPGGTLHLPSAFPDGSSDLLI